MDHRKKDLLKGLPKIDEVMISLGEREAFAKAPRDIVKAICRTVVDELRQKIIKSGNDATDIRLPVITEVADQVMETIDGLHRYRLRKVINATGVVLHTNLGRAPLCTEALKRLMEVAGISEVSARAILAETGPTMDSFKTRVAASARRAASPSILPVSCHFCEPARMPPP